MGRGESVVMGPLLVGCVAPLPFFLFQLARRSAMFCVTSERRINNFSLLIFIRAAGLGGLAGRPLSYARPPDRQTGSIRLAEGESRDPATGGPSVLPK